MDYGLESQPTVLEGDPKNRGKTSLVYKVSSVDHHELELEVLLELG